MRKVTRVAIGQDSHRFCKEPYPEGRKLILGGIAIEGYPPLEGNSDADVIFHALTNAVSGITGVPVLGKLADAMCADGITDSREYLQVALKGLTGRIVHVSFTIEAKQPCLALWMDMIRTSVANELRMHRNNVMLTATSGEELTAFGSGEGIQVFCAITVSGR